MKLAAALRRVGIVAAPVLATFVPTVALACPSGAGACGGGGLGYAGAIAVGLGVGIASVIIERKLRK